MQSIVTTLFEHQSQQKPFKRSLDLRCQCLRKSVKLLFTTEQLGLTGLNYL